MVSSPNNVDVSNTAIPYNARGNVVSCGTSLTNRSYFAYDAYDMQTSMTDKTGKTYTNAYDYRGRRISRISSDKTTYYTYGDGMSVSEVATENNSSKTTLFYRGSDQGGGVGGINYAEHSDGTNLNYKFYNLRGDVIMTTDGNNALKSSDRYFAFGEHRSRFGEIKTDKHRANTKVEDEEGLLNEGKRFRSLEFGIFLTPDPLEYVDGPNPYIYVNQNPWGRWDPLGLKWDVFAIGKTFDVNHNPLPSGNKSVYVSAWAKFLASSDYKLDPKKNYFVAIEINFVCKKEDGSVIDDVITILRPARVNKQKCKVENQEIKGYCQDSGNDVNIIQSDDKNIEVSFRIALYEGDITKQKAKQSNVKFADFIYNEGGRAKYNGLPENQSENMWSAYAQSQIYGIGSAYLTGVKSLEDFEKNAGLKSLDKSEKHTSGYNLEKNYSYNSKNLSRFSGENDANEVH